MSDIKQDDRVDLGNGNYYQLMHYEGIFEGLLLTFADGSRCSVYFRGNTAWGSSGKVNLWTVVSREPLSLSPSIVHNGHHGYITDGQWRPV